MEYSPKDGVLKVSRLKPLWAWIFLMFFDGVGSGLKKSNFSFGHLRDSAPSNKLDQSPCLYDDGQSPCMINGRHSN